MSPPKKVEKLSPEMERERRISEEQASKIRYSERIAVPTMKGRPQQYHQHIIEGASPNDYTIPYDPASLKDTTWRGFVISEDRHGTRYVPVQMDYETLKTVWRDEIVAWDTRSSQAERIEREFTADAFTLRRGCWSDRTPKEILSQFLQYRQDGDKAPSHYLSSLIRRMPLDHIREVYREVIGKGFIPGRRTSEIEGMIKTLLASLTEV